MDITAHLSIDNLSRGERVGSAIVLLGVAIILGLTVKATLTTGPTPKLERQAFSTVFWITFVFLGGVVLSHYTTLFATFRERLAKLAETDSDSKN